MMKKGFRWDFPCSHFFFLTSLSETFEDRNYSLQFEGSCLESIVSRHVRFPQRTYQEPHSCSGARLLRGQKVEVLLSNKVPCESASLGNLTIPTMGDHEEDFWWLPINIQKRIRGIHLLENLAQCRHYNILQEMESQQKIHHCLVDQHLGFKCEELIEDRSDLTVLEEKKNEDQHRRIDLSETQKCRGLLNREPLRATDGVKFFRNTSRPHFRKGAHNVFLWRFYRFNRVKWIGRFSVSFSDNLITWMFIVESDLTEDQRDTYKFSFSEAN